MKFDLVGFELYAYLNVYIKKSFLLWFSFALPLYVVCSCVEFDCKNVLYKSNSYVSVTVIFKNKSTTAILASVQRSTHVHFL